MSDALRFLSAADVVQALPMAAAIEGMKQAFAQLSADKADVPLRARVQSAGTTLVMPAYLSATNDLAVKIVSVFPGNAQKDLPTIHALVLALDAETGQPIALMEGGSLTAIRTGAGAGAATDLLARVSSRVAAIIGSGVQARTQLEAICTVRDIQRVYVYSPTRAHAEAFADEMAGQHPIPDDVIVAESAQEAVQEADIICAATTSSTPVFDGNHLKPGVHVNGVGSFAPDMQEVDLTTIRRALVVVDSREAVLAEAGDLIIPLENGDLAPEHIHAELGDIVNGTRPARDNDEQITYFKSVGVAVQDAIAADIALRHAEKMNLGQVLSL